MLVEKFRIRRLSRSVSMSCLCQTTCSEGFSMPQTAEPRNLSDRERRFNRYYQSVSLAFFLLNYQYYDQRCAGADKENADNDQCNYKGTDSGLWLLDVAAGGGGACLGRT